MRVNDIESKPVTNWLADQSTTNRFNTSCVNTVYVAMDAVAIDSCVKGRHVYKAMRKPHSMTVQQRRRQPARSARRSVD